MQVMRLIVTGQIHAKTAGLLLYALQTASHNLRQIPAHPRRAETVVIEPDAVDNKCVGRDVWHTGQFRGQVQASKTEGNDGRKIG
jgi:hypothetical protein